MLGAISAFVSVVLYYIGLLLVFVALFTFLLPQLLPLVRFPQVVCRPQPHGPRVPCPRVLHAPLCSVLPLPSWRSHASTIP